MLLGKANNKTKKQEFFSQLDELNDDFMIAQSNHKINAGSRTNVLDMGSSSNSMKVNSLQEDMNTPEENIVSKVRSEVDNMMATVEIKTEDAVLTARTNWVILRA